jgi:hypothetical protein
MIFFFVIAGFDPAIHVAERLSNRSESVLLADAQHGCPGQARA